MCLIIGQSIGYYPLGSDVEINGIRIMQEEWKTVKTLKLAVTKIKKTFHLRDDIFIVRKGEKVAVFSAYEYGIGKYFISIFNDKISAKLLNYKTD